jgi:hypothetical protein
MIISQIIGGLGNQMFQYAIGRVLSIQRHQAFQLDISGFDQYHLHHGYQLGHVFNCRPELADQAAIRSLLGWQSSPVVRSVLRRSGASLFRSSALVIEPGFEYWPGISHIPDDCYLSGYWQTEKYFKEHAAVIRSDFSFRTPLMDRNFQISRQMIEKNAVSLHVRRGDYLTAKNAILFQSCDVGYYRRAIELIASKISDPFFYIFSDDPKWVRENLAVDGPHLYVEHNKNEDSYIDMQLMSLCKHHVIANSTFSWWGAWLNASSQKMVVAPRQWFRAPVPSSADLIPDQWVLL